VATAHRTATLTDPVSTATGLGRLHSVCGIAFSPNGKRLASADNNGSTYLWAVG